MPTSEGVPGRVYFKVWRVPPIAAPATKCSMRVVHRVAAAAITGFVLVPAGAGGTYPSIGRN